MASPSGSDSVGGTVFRLFCVLLVALAALPATADAARHRMPQPAPLTIHRELDPACDGWACARPDQNAIWVRPDDTRATIAHETGHVWWQEVATHSDREWITEKLGFPAGTPWMTGTGWPEGSHSPNELAADAYAMCDLGWHPNRGPWKESYGYDPTPRQHIEICFGITVIGLVRAS